MYFIWWLNQADCESIERMGPDALPEGYLRSEFRSRSGRSGRGRLWVCAKTFPYFPTFVRYGDESRLLEFEEHGGIVIRPEEVEFCKTLPGVVTDAQINKV